MSIADNAIASNPPDWVAYVALGVSGLALFISGISLWQSHLSPMRILVASGPLTLRIYPVRSGEELWFVASAIADFTFTNSGARPGTIYSLRLRLDYPEVPVPRAHEYFDLGEEVDPREYDKLARKNREWGRGEEAALGEGAPFILLSKESQTKRLMFTTRWTEPVIQLFIVFTLEVYSDQSRKWQKFTSWVHHLNEDTWVRLTSGKHAMSAHPSSEPIGKSWGETFPPDLHSYTRPKKELVKPVDWEPSYLDYSVTAKIVVAMDRARRSLAKKIRSAFKRNHNGNNP